MTKHILLTAIFVVANLTYATDFPCATFSNHGKSNLIIQNDPNWDDQIVVIDGKNKHGFKKTLKPEGKTKICGTHNEYGVEFYQNGNFARADVSNLDSDKTNLQEIYPDTSIDFEIISQTQESMLINILAINPLPKP